MKTADGAFIELCDKTRRKLLVDANVNHSSTFIVIIKAKGL